MKRTTLLLPKAKKRMAPFSRSFGFTPSDGWSNNRKVEHFGCCCFFFPNLPLTKKRNKPKAKWFGVSFYLFVYFSSSFCLCFCSSSLKPYTSYTFLLSCFHSWFPLKPWHVIISTKLPGSLFGASKHLSSLNWISFTFVKVKNCKWRGRSS